MYLQPRHKKVHWCTHFHDTVTQNIYSEASDSRSTQRNALKIRSETHKRKMIRICLRKQNGVLRHGWSGKDMRYTERLQTQLRRQ